MVKYYIHGGINILIIISLGVKRNYSSEGNLKNFLKEFKQVYRIKETTEKRN